MKANTTLSLLLIATLSACSSSEEEQTTNIRVNQVGYYPTAPKMAVVEKDGWADQYTLTNVDSREVVWKGQPSHTTHSPFSDKQRATLDFSSVTAPGTYILSNGREKQTIVIAPQAFNDVARKVMHAFYLQRTGEPILEKHAGKYARPAAHPDDSVLVHPSAATDKRPEGTVISSPGGWYDAGDYNKYIVNSAYSIAVMLCAFENLQNPNIDLDIPESSNQTPDILDEIMVNLRWMQTMQDPNDGGVYHKLTTPSFEGFVAPTECHQKRYVVAKSTAATLDFAAVMAQASRIYSRYPEYESWAADALAQAKAAYEWAQQNPTVYYDQDAMNQRFSPAISTGTYGDFKVDDEQAWAAAELWLTTHDDKYDLRHGDYSAISKYQIPTWGSVGELEILSVLNNQTNEHLASLITAYADEQLAKLDSSSFASPYGNRAADFGWGCIGELGSNMGIALLYAHKLSGDKKYLDGALLVADYIMGRNATGYCYITGAGTHSPRNPHHRLSAADTIGEPLPGFVVGGPNAGQQDREGCHSYTSSLPDESYTDDEQSYASNEIAINWNASAAAFLLWLAEEMDAQQQS